MSAQNELQQLFHEIDERADRALAGLSTVRESAKLKSVRPSLLLSSCQVGFIAALVFMVGDILRRGG
ncbi:hypothetical protein [Roseibium sp.]|uniref:hypothetical protein n=1 Tax=Roseibium sp. TaxID=1936156 RepID=UPI003A98755D